MWNKCGNVTGVVKSLKMVSSSVSIYHLDSILAKTNKARAGVVDVQIRGRTFQNSIHGGRRYSK